MSNINDSFRAIRGLYARKPKKRQTTRLREPTDLTEFLKAGGKVTKVPAPPLLKGPARG